MQCWILTLSTTVTCMSSTAHIVHPPEKHTVYRCHRLRSQCVQRLTTVCFGPLSLMQFNAVSFALGSQMQLPWWHALKKRKKNISQLLVIASLQPCLKFFFLFLSSLLFSFLYRNLGWEISGPWLNQRMSSAACNYPSRISTCYSLYREHWFQSIQTIGASTHSKLQWASWWLNLDAVWDTKLPGSLFWGREIGHFKWMIVSIK